MTSEIDSAIELHRAGRLADADEIYRRILVFDKDNFDATHLSGLVALQQGDMTTAIRILLHAIELNPLAPSAPCHLGAAFRCSGRLDEAKHYLERALELTPAYPEALNELGIVYRLKHEHALAQRCFERAIEYNPNLAEAHCNLGAALKDSGQLPQAIECFVKAISVNPEFVEAHFLLAKTYQQKGMLAEALAGYQETLQYKPDLAEAHFNLGHILHDQAFDEDALKCFQAALEYQPDFVEAKWAIAMSQLTLVYGAGQDPLRFRTAFSEALSELEAWFDDSRRHLGYLAVGSQQPFYIAYQETDNCPVLSRYGDLCARLMNEWQTAEGIAALPLRTKRSKIHVGIVSAHIRDQSVWTAITRGWVGQIDRDKFSICLFHVGDTEDEETIRAKMQVDRFVHGLPSLRTWSAAIAEAQLDVLIYPEVGMDPLTLKLAALRLAPVQLAAWGHPETTGLPTIDYYLSSEDFEPPAADSYYRETLIQLPHLGCYYQPLEVPLVQVDLKELEIDTGAPILICPGTPYKYTQQHDDVLIRIAAALQRCQFIFFEHMRGNLSQKLAERLESSFSEAGLDFHRYGVFIPWLNRPAFYGLLRKADLLLDTIGFSGFNTAMQAVETGLPIVAYDGRFMRGRLAAGILRRMGLSEFIATSHQTYVELAVRLASDACYRSSVRDRIEKSRDRLFDDMFPVHAFEQFLTRVANEKSQRSNAPLA